MICGVLCTFCDKKQVRLIERISKAGNQLVIYKIQDNFSPVTTKEDSYYLNRYLQIMANFVSSLTILALILSSY